MQRIEFINKIIEKYQYKDYLEIGVRGGVTFRSIQCNNKTGVDPVGNPTYKMTSDEFFKQNKNKFDIIFIDGLHTKEQALRDVENSLKVLKSGGIIVMHDCNPHAEYLQVDEDDPRKQSAWCGTVWKAWVSLRRKRSNLFMYVVNTDFGLGVIKKGIQECLKDDTELTWEYLHNNRQMLLNLISVDTWINEYL